MDIFELLNNSIGGEFIMTALVSMLPIVELRGGIPYGVSAGLPLYLSVIASVIGNMIPIPFLILFTRRVFEWLRKHMPKLDGFIGRLEARAVSKRDLVVKYKFWGLLILVAIPLPGTGAWTGALVAAVLNLRIKMSLPAIFVGVLVAAAIVTLVTLGIISI